MPFAHAERGYAESWDSLRDDPIAKGQPAFLDIDLGGNVISGYNYTIVAAGQPVISVSGVPGNSDFMAYADPVNPGRFGSGIYHYYTDASGVLRYALGAQADGDSAAL